MRYVNTSLFDSFPFCQILIHLIHTRLPRGKPSKASDLLRRATSSLPYPHWRYFTFGESATDEEEALPDPTDSRGKTGGLTHADEVHGTDTGYMVSQLELKN